MAPISLSCVRDRGICEEHLTRLRTSPGPLLPTAIAALLFAASATANAGPGTFPLRPDLVIVDVQVAQANPTRLRIRVANQGLAPAAETQIEIACHTDRGVLTRVAAVPMLGTGERQWFLVEAGIPLKSAHAIALHVDSPSRIIESDERNNRFVYR
jgi:subtilase family serine protease